MQSSACSGEAITATKGHLSGGSHLDLLTRYGPLDLLARIGQDLGFPELLRHSIEMSD